MEFCQKQNSQAIRRNRIARRVDAAETLFSALAVFFRHRRGEIEDSETPPTAKKTKHDFNSLMHGKHDSKLVIENISPRLTGGKRKIIDELFKDTAQFKETEEANIKE